MVVEPPPPLKLCVDVLLLVVIVLVISVFLHRHTDVLGHPFGKPPSPHPFEGSTEEAKILLSDPSNPVGKDMLACKYRPVDVVLTFTPVPIIAQLWATVRKYTSTLAARPVRCLTSPKFCPDSLSQ